MGFEVRRITCIRDDLELAVEFFHGLFERKPNVVIVSGGLGPTYDDIQLAVMSKATNIEIDENQEALEQVREYYKTKGLELTKERRKMANMLINSTVLDNKVGGAPGCLIQYENIDIFCLPGVPSEMKDIFTRHIIPFLSSKGYDKLYEIKFRVLNCFESQLAPFINQIKGKFPFLYIKSHPVHEESTGIVFHLSGFGDEAKKHIYKARKMLEQLFISNIESVKIEIIRE